MNWGNETILKFVKLYQMNECIWDPQNENHKNRLYVSEAWNHIRDNIGVPSTVSDLKKKKESLMATYRAYRRKIEKFGKNEYGEDVFQPSWFAFNLMDSFLGPIYTCSTTVNIKTENAAGGYSPDDSTHEESAQDLKPSRKTQQDVRPSSHSQSRKIPKRKLHSSPEVIKAKKQMDEAFSILKEQLSQRQEHQQDCECSIFGALVAKKLQKLPEECRDEMMVKINQLFVDMRRDSRLFNSTNGNHYGPNVLSPTVEVYIDSTPKDEDNETQ